MSEETGDKAGLDFYFGRPTEMMRKLESSKPVRRTRADKKTPGSDGAVNSGDLTDNQGGYLFKWQREQDEDQDDEEEETAQDQASKSRARWQVLTGNVPSSSLSVGAYFEKDGPKGKPLRDGLVNAGGVIMIQPGTTSKSGGKLNLGELSMLNETGKGAFFHDDHVLSLRSKDELAAMELDKTQEERLVFRRNVQWPPEAPGFPPPPPDGNEAVQPKRVPITNPGQSLVVRRMSRFRPVDGKTGSPRALLSTPENAAAEVGAPTARALELSSMGGSMRGDSLMARTRAASSMSKDPTPVPVSKAPVREVAKAPEKKGFLRRISFMPGLGGKKEESSGFPGIYASYIIVPYILPPPPQPPKHPPPGSNDERRQQKQNLKRMFLEDLYSQVLELADEKIRLNEMCRDLEAQITDADAQINQLIGASDQ